MIPLPPELERVENDLKERRITGSEASSIVFSVREKLGPPWQWKSWKTATRIYGCASVSDDQIVVDVIFLKRHLFCLVLGFQPTRHSSASGHSETSLKSLLSSSKTILSDIQSLRLRMSFCKCSLRILLIAKCVDLTECVDFYRV